MASDKIPFEHIQIRRAFGLAYRSWMLRNDISQQMPNDWAKATGSLGPWNSQISQLTSRNDTKRLDPKALFWVGLGDFNQAIAHDSYPPTLSRRIRDILTSASPFLTPSDSPATASDLFAMWIGAMPIHPQYQAREYSAEDAERITLVCQNAFRERCLELVISRLEGWLQFEPYIKDYSAAQTARFREVLSGWSEFDADELTTFPVDPLQLMQQWFDKDYNPV